MTSQRMRTLKSNVPHPLKTGPQKIMENLWGLSSSVPFKVSAWHQCVCMQKQSPVLNELLLSNFDTFWIYSGFMQHSWAIFGDSQETVDLTEDVGKGYNVDKGLSVHCMPIRHTLLYRICWCISSVRPFEPANTTHGIHHIQI